MNEALRFQYQNDSVTILTVKPLEEFKIHGSSFGPAEKDRELVVPRWVAAILIANNSARLKEPEIKVPDLQKALWRETGEPVLQPLPPDFYFKAKDSIEQLAAQNKAAPNGARFASQTKMEQLLRDLLAHRLLKLMKLSLHEERPHETKKKMTEEERWLFDRLMHLLRSWQSQILEIGPSD